MASRGSYEASKAYTTSATTILEFECPHTSKRGVVFFLYPSTAGTATFSYIDPSDNVRTLQTTSCAANDLTAVTFNFPISKVRLAYQGTSSGGNISAEGRGH